MSRRWDKSKPPSGPFALNRDCPQAVGLVAWWPMGGASGPKLVVDKVGPAHLAGTASSMTLGPTGAPTCVFNGSSDVLTAAAAPVTAMPLTLAGWATAGSSSLVGSILSLDAGLATFASANFYRLVVVGSASPKQVRANQGNSGSEVQATYGAGWVAGREFHVAGVFSGVASRDVYYNGAIGASDTTNLTAPTVSQAVLGRHSVTGSEQYWSGSLGEAGVWNVALPAHIIARLYDPGTRYELWYPLRSRKWMVSVPSAPTLASANLSAAIQQAQALTASLSTAVQAPRTVSAVTDAAVQAAAAAQANLDAAVQQARSAVTAVQTAVQAAGLQTTSIDGAVQLARSATIALDLAVQAHLSETAAVNLQVQSAASVTASVNMQIQAGSSASVSLGIAILQNALSAIGLDLAVLHARSQTAGISTALQAARSATAAIDIALQIVRSSNASVNLQIQDGVSALASIDVAVQQARNAVTGVQLAIGQSSMVSASLDAVLMLQRTVSATLNTVIVAPHSMSTIINLYILINALGIGVSELVTGATVLDSNVVGRLVNDLIIGQTFNRLS